MSKWLAYLLFGGAVFGVSYYYNKRFMEWLRFQSLGTRDFIVERLNQMFIDIPPQKILLYLILAAVVPGGLVFLLCMPHLAPGLIFGTLIGMVGWILPKPIVNWIYKRRVNKFVLQMVDALSLMSNGLKSGLSVVQALSLVTLEMSNPIQQEFGLVLNENKLGVPLEDAFSNLSKRVVSDDVEMFVTSINILKETGGNLAETFDTIVTTIRERIKVEGKIAAMTATGVYQGFFVMGIVPLLAAVFYQSDPTFMEPLFTKPLGWAIIVLIVVLEAIAFFAIMKITKIDV